MQVRVNRIRYNRAKTNMKKMWLYFVVLLLLMMSGCSIVSIGYNYAEAYLRYSINSYATFNTAQKERIKKEVDEFMLWHRKMMLPQYVSFLQQIQGMVQVENTLNLENVNRLKAEARKLYVKTLQPTVRPAASLLSGADAAQIEELVTAFARENNKQRDKELVGTQDERLRKRAERTIDFIENLVGGLSDAQQEKIREQSHDLPFATELYIQLREENQAGLIALLKNSRGESDIAAFLSVWLNSPEANRSAEEQKILISFENASEEMTISVYAMLSERQRKTLLKNITKYIDTFKQLANAT